MKKLMILAAVLGILAMASMSFAQNIGITFDEAGTQTTLDGRTGLLPNPALGNLPSAFVYVIAYDIPEVFGYEYFISSTDATAIAGTPVFYPTATSANFGVGGDVRVGTGVCFGAGSADAGPVATQIRLAKHVFSFFATPADDIIYTIGPSTGAGGTAPHYTECVSSPTPLDFGLANHSLNLGCAPDGAAVVILQWTAQNTPARCDPQVVGSKETSWGALKSGF